MESKFTTIYINNENIRATLIQATTSAEVLSLGRYNRRRIAADATLLGLYHDILDSVSLKRRDVLVTDAEGAE